MIVCSATAIREDEIRDAAARNGCAHARAAYATLDCEPLCGCCLDYAQELIDEELPKRPKLRVVG